jgi:hypothetical protein
MLRLFLIVIFFSSLSGFAATAPTKATESTVQHPVYHAGMYAIIQNSTDSWTDQVVEISDVFEDGSVRVKLNDGTKAFIRSDTITKTLAPDVKCVDSHGVKICAGDKVYYPLHAASVAVPEATVDHIFSNGKVQVLAGLHHVFDIEEIGKETKCSPQKPSVCEGDYVVANGYRDARPFTFEGAVEKAYSNGIVMVASSYFWRFPVNVSGVVKRTETNDAQTTGSIIVSNAVGKSLGGTPYTPEVDTGKSYDPFASQQDEKKEGK